MIDTKSSSFVKKIINNTAFALLDQILFKAGTTVAFILLVRLLPSTDIIAIGIGMGYLVLITYFDIGLTRILLRDYPKIRSDSRVRDEHFTAYFTFWALQAAVMLALTGGIQFFFLNKLESSGLSFLFWGMTIDFIAMGFQDWIKGIFYADFKQGFVTKIGFVLTILRLASYAILLLYPSLNTYTWLLIGAACASSTVWCTALFLKFKFRPLFTRGIPGILKHALSDYAIWNHLNRTAVNTLLLIDLLILTLLGLLSDVGNYAIALRVTSLLFLIPWQLSRSLQVTLSNYSEKAEQVRAINTFLKVNGVISFAQLAFILAFGDWLIGLLFGTDVETDVVRFTTIITVGVTIMSQGWPLVGIINNLCSLRQAFLTVFLPVLVIGVLVYIGAAIYWGAIGIAYGNIVVYAMLVSGLAFFVWRQFPFPIKFQLVTLEERKLIRELIRGRIGGK